MRTVQKYPIDLPVYNYTEFDITMPFGANILKTITISGYLSIFAEVENTANLQKRRFCMVKNDYEISTEYCTKFIDTFIYRDLVFHIFEILN